jgi:hypothetical protein
VYGVAHVPRHHPLSRQTVVQPGKLGRCVSGLGKVDNGREDGGHLT